ncbi:MAG: acetyltransferase [Emcibacteraceae bacterium]|nr:acetyltransferase [Emcibacteraceae bacterium]
MKIAIFGASGLGREVADVCLEIGYDEVVFLVKDVHEICIWPNKVLVDNEKNVNDLEKSGFNFAIAIGDPKIRNFVAEKHPTLNYPNIIHPTVILGSYQKEIIENSKGVIIAAGCHITNNVSIGNFVFMNVNVTIGHDCIIGNFVSFMTGATISGNVSIKELAYIGCNASIMHGHNDKKITIGAGSTVGMGAVVLRSIKNGVTVFGNPARKI